MKRHKWSWVIRYGEEAFGKHGFRPPGKKELRTLNISDLEAHVDSWLSAGKAKLENARIAVNLTELGYDKLLGAGRPTRPFLVSIQRSSQQATLKIKETGGEVLLAPQVSGKPS